MKEFFIISHWAITLLFFVSHYVAISFPIPNGFTQIGHWVWPCCNMKSLNNIEDDRPGDEAPRLKDLIIVVVVFAVLTLLSWIAYYRLGWFR